MCRPAGKMGWLKIFHTFTKRGSMRHATYIKVVEWVDKAWTNVSTSTVQSGFIKAGVVPKSVEEEKSKYTDEESDNELSDVLPESILELFESDSEESDFEGFH